MLAKYSKFFTHLGIFTHTFSFEISCALLRLVLLFNMQLSENKYILKNNLTCKVIIIIIIMMSFRQHRYPWPSLATSPYRSSPLAGLQGYILYPRRAAVCMFELVVLLLLGHMWGSIGVHHLWARIAGVLWGVASRTCSILLAAFLRNCRLAFSPAVLLKLY